MTDLERVITDHIDRHPNLKGDAELLRSIPGMGKTTVAKVLVYAGDVRRFVNAKSLAAFIEVTPRQRVSGSSVKGRTMMSLYRACRFTPCVVHAGPGRPVTQSCPQSLRRSAAGLGVGSQSRGRRRHAGAGPSYLRGDQVWSAL
jgi:hypothetical protein